MYPSIHKVYPEDRLFGSNRYFSPRCGVGWPWVADVCHKHHLSLRDFIFNTKSTSGFMLFWLDDRTATEQ